MIINFRLCNSFDLNTKIFSSPEPKAHKVSLYDARRAGVRLSVRASVH